MRIDILTIFPKMFEAVLGESIMKRAQQKGIVKINIHNLRDFSRNKHKKVDDRPFGGGPGMVLKPEPIFEAVEYITRIQRTENSLPWPLQRAGQGAQRIILLSPQGRRLNQKVIKRLSKCKHLILICGHYEGVDERVKENLITDEISIGDYVLTGGELPAMVVIDAVIRLIPGVLGDSSSIDSESFSEGLLEYPQYTRPAVYRGMGIPKVLLSGDHRRIKDWRKLQSSRRTRKVRPDLIRAKQTPDL